MVKRVFIPIPPPAPIPDPEAIDIHEIFNSYAKGEIDLICVMGPTASGKTRYAVKLARRFNEFCKDQPECGLSGAEILSGDSRQV